MSSRMLPPGARRISPYLMRIPPLFLLVGVIALAAPRCRRAPAPATRRVVPAACCVGGAPRAAPSAADVVTTASTKLFSFTAATDNWTTQSF